MKVSVKEMILREEVKNWFLKRTKYDDNMHKTYALILGRCAEGLKKNYKRENIGKRISKTNQLVYLNQ